MGVDAMGWMTARRTWLRGWGRAHVEFALAVAPLAPE